MKQQLNKLDQIAWMLFFGTGAAGVATFLAATLQPNNTRLFDLFYGLTIGAASALAKHMPGSSKSDIAQASDVTKPTADVVSIAK